MVDNTELLQRIEKLEKQVELLQAEINAIKNIEVSEKAREQIDKMDRANKLVSLMENLSGEKMPDAQKDDEIEVLRNISQQAEKEVQSSIETIEEFIDNSANESDFEWRTYQDGVEITKYVGMSQNIVVTPSRISGRKVLSIARHAFKGCIEIEKVIISDGVINIGNGAFLNCKLLKEINLPKTLKTIGSDDTTGCTTRILHTIRCEGAFEGTSLENVVIPDSVEFLGSYSFSGCSNLKSIVLSMNLKTIKEDTFSFCRNLEKVFFPKYLETIESTAFWYCESIKELFLPEGVKNIEQGVFDNCKKLEKIYIPNSVEVMGDGPRRRNSPLFGQVYERPNNFTIFCNPGSYAMQYAREHQIKCEKYRIKEEN